MKTALTSKLKDNLKDLKPKEFYFRGERLHIILFKSTKNNNHEICIFGKELEINGYQAEPVSNLLIRLSVEQQKSY